MVLVLGCQKGPDGQTDYGPEVSPDSVEAELTKAAAESDPNKIEIGQFVHFADVQTINGRDGISTVISDTGQTVVDRRESERQVIFTVVQDKYTYSSNQEPRRVKTELELAFDKLSSRAVSSYISASSWFLKPFHVLSANDGRVLSTKQTRITYHNLRVANELVAPPKLVAEHAGCREIPNCRIRVRHVAFDQVTWNSESGPEKIAFQFSLSPDVPYLASLMNRCASLLVPYKENETSPTIKVLVTQCSPVQNFRWRAESEQPAGAESEQPAENEQP